MIDPALQRSQRLAGIGLMCGAVAMFACLDATAKFLGGHMDPLQATWARYTSALVLTLFISNPISRPGLLKTQRPMLQIVRSVLLLASTLLNFLAIQYLQLDQALAILFSLPFLVAILSGPILGEWVGWRRWTAIAVGFIGVLLVTRPGFGGIHPAALFSVAAAVSLALYNIATRALASSDSNETTLFYSNFVGALLMLPVVPFVWITPGDPVVLFFMVLIGAFGAFGHYLLIAGHRFAPASVLAPFVYTQMVWVIALGYLVFSQSPNRWTLTGAAIVVASGLYLLYRERKVRGEA